MIKVLVILLWFFSLVFTLGPVYAAEPAATEQKPADPTKTFKARLANYR